MYFLSEYIIVLSWFNECWIYHFNPLLAKKNLC